MKGKNLVKIPGELYAPTPNGTVVSADGVKDYRLGTERLLRLLKKPRE